MEKSILLTIVTISVILLAGVLSLTTLSNFDEIAYEYRYSIPENKIIFDKTDPIKIGIIHSLSGTMASSESRVVDATLFAIDEINASGGVLDRELVPIVKDGRSDWDVFADEANYLINEEDVDVIFGGWTSASRKTMKPIFEENDHLLFYPVQYEGLELSKNIVYTGASPNQQVLPAVEWAFENLGTRFFLVGSDYVFPRSANEIIKEKIGQLGGSVVGEEYRLLGDENFEQVVEKIIKSKPDVILNTINGDSNVGFFDELRSRQITSETIPTISFSIAESEVQQIGVKKLEGDYASWNYFQSLDSNFNKKFVSDFKSKYGESRTVDDPMEAAYAGVHIYAKAVKSAGTTDVEKVRKQLKGITFDAPGETIGIDPETQHASKIVRIGQVEANGQFSIVYSSEQPISPKPFPDYKTKQQWILFLNNMYEGWNGNWANPGNES